MGEDIPTTCTRHCPRSPSQFSNRKMGDVAIRSGDIRISDDTIQSVNLGMNRHRRYTWYIEEPKYIEVLKIIRTQIPHRRIRDSDLIPGLSRDQKVEIERAPSHVRENFDGRRSIVLLPRGPDSLFEFRILIEHALEDTRVPLSDFPVLPDLPECRDEEVDFGIHSLVDGRAVDEEEAG